MACSLKTLSAVTELSIGFDRNDRGSRHITMSSCLVSLPQANLQSSTTIPPPSQHLSICVNRWRPGSRSIVV
jgi:hypothetical protein